MRVSVILLSLALMVVLIKNQVDRHHHTTHTDPQIEEILKLQDTTRKMLEELTALNAKRNSRQLHLAMTAACAAHYLGTNGYSWEYASNKVWTAISVPAITTKLP